MHGSPKTRRSKSMRKQLFICSIVAVLAAGVEEGHAAPYVRPSVEELKPVHNKFQQVVEKILGHNQPAPRLVEATGPQEPSAVRAAVKVNLPDGADSPKTSQQFALEHMNEFKKWLQTFFNSKPRGSNLKKFSFSLYVSLDEVIPEAKSFDSESCGYYGSKFLLFEQGFTNEADKVFTKGLKDVLSLVCPSLNLNQNKPALRNTATADK